MSTLGLKVFDETVQLSNAWLNDLMDRMGWDDKQRAYRLLRASLHALRDRLSPEEASHLAAQLPMLIRGIYYEGWHPAGKPLKERTRAEFVGHVEEAFKTDPLSFPDESVSTVIAMLYDKLCDGEMDDVRHAMPRRIRELFLEPAEVED